MNLLNSIVLGNCYELIKEIPGQSPLNKFRGLSCET